MLYRGRPFGLAPGFYEPRQEFRSQLKTGRAKGSGWLLPFASARGELLSVSVLHRSPYAACVVPCSATPLFECPIYVTVPCGNSAGARAFEPFFRFVLFALHSLESRGFSVAGLVAAGAHLSGSGENRRRKSPGAFTLRSSAQRLPESRRVQQVAITPQEVSSPGPRFRFAACVRLH